MSAVAAAAVGTRRGVASGGVRRDRHEPSYALLLAVMALTGIGVVMVYSASSVRSYFNSADPAAQGLEQLVWAGIGLTALVVAMRLDFRHLRYLAIPIYVITLGLLVAVLVPGIGAEINGSQRWIIIPGVGTLQPAEFAKLAVVLYLAHWLDRRGKEARSFWNGLIPFGLLVAPGFFLIAIEPDLGTAGVYAIVAISIFFMAGANLLYLTAIGAGVMAAAWVMVSSTGGMVSSLSETVSASTVRGHPEAASGRVMFTFSRGETNAPSRSAILPRSVYSVCLVVRAMPESRVSASAASSSASAVSRVERIAPMIR